MDDIVTVQESVPTISDDRIIQMAENAERRIEAIKKIKTIALRVTNPSDWIDQQGKPYLQASGSTKVARVFGVSWRIDEPVREDFEDGHFQFTVKGEFSLAGATIEAMGVRNSKDGFFSRRYKWDEAKREKVPYDVPPHEIDAGDVKKAALTNLLGIGVTTILGIRNLSWEEIATTMGFGKEDVQSIQYGDKRKGSKKAPLKPPKKSSEKGKKGSSVEDRGKKGAIPWADRVDNFVKIMQAYEEKLGQDVYANILLAHEVDPPQLKDMTEEEAMKLYADMEKAYQDTLETEEE